jgi:hypothetical protein
VYAINVCQDFNMIHKGGIVCHAQSRSIAQQNVKPDIFSLLDNACHALSKKGVLGA